MCTYVAKENPPIKFLTNTILYIKATCLSMTDILGGGGRESPVKHRAGGGQQGGASTDGGGGTGGEGPTGALCTGFTLIQINSQKPGFGRKNQLRRW